MAVELCKVKFDGNSYLASPYVNKNKYYFADEIVQMNNDDERLENLNKKDYFYSLWARENFGNGKKGKKKKSFFERLNNEISLIYLQLLENEENDKKELINMITEILLNDISLMEEFKIIQDLEEFIYNYVKNRLSIYNENVLARRRRFRNKAYANDFNYFTTFTYDNVIFYEYLTKNKWLTDDKGKYIRDWDVGLKFIENNKEDIENLFKKKLSKKLQDLHTRNNWCYMGVWEKGSKNDRLHFHCFLLIPDDEHIGIFKEETRYNKETKTTDTIFINSYFEKKFGRNDFEEIVDKTSETFFRELEYIIKYITKSNDKIVYSRGLKDYDFVVGDFENYKICKLSDQSPYYVMCDEFIYNSLPLDKELNLKQNTA